LVSRIRQDAGVKTKNQPTTVDYQTLESAFLQGDEKQASELFNEMMRKSVRLGLLAALEEEVASLCGPKYQPASDSPCCRAGSEKGSAYINGEREEITRPRVRHEDDGEVVLNTYRAARSQRNLFADVTSAMLEGMSRTSRLEAARANPLSAPFWSVSKSGESMNPKNAASSSSAMAAQRSNQR